MNSANSLFESCQSNIQSNQDYFIKNKQKRREIIKKKKSFKNEAKESECESNDIDMLSMSMDEISEDKSNIQLTYSDEDVKAVDEEIEMERIMKMNFYKFKSQNQNGIIGMCQKIKNK